MNRILAALLAGLVSLTGGLSFLPMDEVLRAFVSWALAAVIATLSVYLGRP